MIQAHSKQTSGFTLIEMMVSVALITLILSGVLQFYLMTLRQQVISQEIQDRALQRQLLITELQTSFHNAGYFGCRSFRGYFKAFEINPKPLPSAISLRNVKGSDVLKLTYWDPFAKPVSCHLAERFDPVAFITEYWYIRGENHALYRQTQARAERIADHIEALKAESDTHGMQITLNWADPNEPEILWFALPNLT